MGKDRDAGTLPRVFAGPGPRCARAIRVVCCDMGRPYLAGVRAAVPEATVGFDRFHVTRYATEAGGPVRRRKGRQLAEAETPDVTRTRFLWLKSPAHLRREERTRLSDLLRLTAPLVKAYLVQEDLRGSWASRSTAWATAHLRQGRWRASQSRLPPFQTLAKPLRPHWDGLLAWPKRRVTHGALEGMTTKGTAISHRAFGFRTPWTYMATIDQCCAALPLP